MNQSIPRDTPAWRFLSWASFVIALGMTLLGILFLPATLPMKAFFTMGILYTTGSAFTLAKTLRDEHEASRAASSSAASAARSDFAPGHGGYR
jgi:hypothetical protein